MNIKNRIKKLEDKTQNDDLCQCSGNDIATSKEAFDAPARCAACRSIVKPSVLVVGDLSETADFDYPVKIYARFDANLV